MSLATQSVSEFLAAVRSPSPTPGGGSAAALAGAMGASLLAMVAGLPKNKAATEEDTQRLRAAGDRCTAITRS
jgi:formiminotetrahydrofolate cyclodeaminase